MTNDDLPEAENDNTLSDRADLVNWDDRGRLALLRGLISDLCHREPGGFGVTLHVGGTLVSGTAVAVSAWMRATAGDEPRPEELRSSKDAVIQALYDGAEEAKSAPEKSPGEVLHVNMVDVRIWPIGAGGSRQLRAWQVPLSRVDGWTLGELQASTG